MKRYAARRSAGKVIVQRSPSDSIHTSHGSLVLDFTVAAVQEAGSSHHDGPLCDREARQAASAHQLGVGPEAAKHHVGIGAERPVRDQSQAASTSFTSRTALLASSA